MGTLAKRLGQIAARSVETESANILKTCAANKIPGSLAQRLDGTLKDGHDMKAFGLGTAATMASVQRYGSFTRSMHAVYSTMEEELDACGPETTPAVHTLWCRHGNILRRAPALAADLADVATQDWLKTPLSPSTQAYVARIRSAAEYDRARNGARLLGHVYCRYFADLFGGQMLAFPTRAALDLETGTPRHYTFDLPADLDRRSYIESLYSDLSIAGNSLQKGEQDAVVKEALSAFQHNIEVYTEEPVIAAAVWGVINVATGLPRQMIRSRSG